jgi:hypothetical protein
MKLRHFVIVAALAATSVTPAPAAPAQLTPLVLSSPFAPEHASSRAMEIFKAEAPLSGRGRISTKRN